MAKLYFYYGVMGSSKSANLLLQAHSFDEKGIEVLCLKSSLDTRDGNKIKSRLGIERECALIEKDTDLFHAIKTYYVLLKENKRNLQWILVDEAQFLTKEQIDALALVVDEFNINVCCYGLRTDFQTNFFEGSKRLMEIADDFIEIKSMCKCGRKASVNARINSNGELILNGSQVEIEGDTIYEPMCRKCYNEQVLKQFNSK